MNAFAERVTTGENKNMKIAGLVVGVLLFIVLISVVVSAVPFLKGVFVALGIVIGFGLAGHTVYWLFRYIAMGKPEARFDSIRERIGSFLVHVLGQGRVMMEFGGLLHVFIFWGFLILQLETLEYFARGFYAGFHWSIFFGDSAYHVLLFLQDIFGLLVLIAIGIAFVRRFIVKPDHVVVSADALIIVILISSLMVTKFFANGAEIALGNHAHDVAWTPLAAIVASIMGGGEGAATGSGAMEVMYHFNYFLHLGIVFFFANWIPNGKHLHLLGAMPNVFFRHFDEKHAGALPYVDMDEVEEAMIDEERAETFYIGAKEVEDLTWKQLLDTYACTECGRCEAYCPAYNTGKALNPMMIIHNLKDALKAKGEGVLRRKEDPESFPTLTGEVITREELWACTTCGACVTNCPVFIEHVSTIVDMRRYLAFTSDIPQELQNAYRNFERASNPWGVSKSKRADWAKGLDIPLLKECTEPPEYLFFVGCAGSFDDRQKKVTMAFAEILKAAGVTFAILGKEEGCTGDTARRTGNEYLYYTQATENIETFKKYDVTKVITTCPHCFHTIGKEYPQLGGNYETLHHTQVIADLQHRGLLDFNPVVSTKVTYHDSCYLGRWGNDYESPRKALSNIPGVELQEMTLNKRQSMCCGAGGGRMWMEEHAGKRVNVERIDQALDTSPEVVAVACPFCMTMLDDGLKHRGADEQVKALDIAEIVAGALKKPASAEG